jgi:hypothetical protein
VLARANSNLAGRQRHPGGDDRVTDKFATDDSIANRKYMEKTRPSGARSIINPT